MASSTYGHHSSHPGSHRGPSIAAAPNIPSGTLPPGTPITVGAHKCTIDRYLSEGGFAHVYLVRLAQPANGSDVAVLKRVAVPDKEALANMRTEVVTMKRLRGHRHIVTYIDSHVSPLRDSGYEVFLLMEYCSGGGLIDFMNTRLQNRLTELEVLHIFGDVIEGVACMHYLQPPLLHRDLKVENVLIASNRGYMLCDFGSSAPVQPAPQTAVECRLLEEDIQKHTTLQYRSPEMVDVFRRLPIDEKSDIWALGVLLYKLCYYTTPFEEQGQLAILNASFKFPPYPRFSDRLKNLIALMLREHPRQRPNIYQVVVEVCRMRGKEVPIPDIYSTRTASASKSADKVLPALPVQSPPSIVAYQAPSAPQQPVIPDIAPMRRGRPSKSQSPAVHSAAHSAANSRTRADRPSPQIGPTTLDPFAALDGKQNFDAQDELSSRFPSVEQFSLLHDSSSRGKFQFGETPSPSPLDVEQDLGTRVAERLAEAAFGTSPERQMQRTPQESRPLENLSRGITGVDSLSRPKLYEPQPTRPAMVSTGTMTSPTPSPAPSPRYELPPQNQELTSRPSDSPRGPLSESQVRVSTGTRQNPTQAMPQNSNFSTLLDTGRTHTGPSSRVPSSSRPSLEVARSSSAVDVSHGMSRSRSANSRPRPHSLYVESNIEFLRDLDSPSTQDPSTAGMPPIGGLRLQNSGQSISSQRSEHIESNVDFLRAMETEADAAKGDRRSVSGNLAKHAKRASMPSISLPTTKGLLSGKFGDAFRRFEKSPGGSSGSGSGTSLEQPSTLGTDVTSRRLMPTISGSQATTSDGGDDWEVTSSEVPPEVRRELEKRQLSQEEKRVAAAAAEYKKQVSNLPQDGGEATRPRSSRNRANSIQKRVHALLNENKDPPPKTAEGYGRYTAEPLPTHEEHAPLTGSRGKKEDSYRTLKTNSTREEGSSSYRSSSAMDQLPKGTRIESRPASSASAPSKITRKAVAPGTPAAASTASRPNPPPKPNKLRTGGSTAVSPTKPQPTVSEAELSGGNRGDGTEEDWERKFARRYPSLSGLEMVETVVGRGDS